MGKKKIFANEIVDAEFSDGQVQGALAQMSVDLVPGHTYVGSMPQYFHGEKNRAGRNSNRIWVFEFDENGDPIGMNVMPYSMATAMFIFLKDEWNGERVGVRTMLHNNDETKPYLRPDCSYTPVTTDGNVQFEVDEAKKCFYFDEPFALHCDRIATTINAAYQTQGKKLYDAVTKLRTDVVDGIEYAHLSGRSTALFSKVEGKDLQELLSKCPSTVEGFKKYVTEEVEDGDNVWASVEKFLVED